MKQLLPFIILFSLTISNQAIAQIVSIPDSIFKSKLIALGIDADQDNEISYQEAASVDSLDVKAIVKAPPPFYVYVDTISTLKGIEAFINLEYLDCSYNKIDTLDLMNNGMLKVLIARSNEPLVAVNLNNNPLLEELQLLVNNNLSDIDISSQTNLKTLDISYTNISNPDFTANINLESLLGRQYIASTIDISPLVNLESLDFSQSELTTLDVSSNSKLKTLDTDSSPLKNIVISGNDSLTDLSTNYGELTSLNLLGAPNLVTVNCTLNELTSLNVAGLQKLKTLNCGLNELVNLNVSNNTSLAHISCTDNEISQITFGNNNALKWLYCSDNKLTNIDLSQAPVLSHFEAMNNLFTSLIIEHPTLRNLFLHGNTQLSYLDITKTQSIRNLQLNYMPQPIQVCVWELPFPPIDSIYIIVGEISSPNITFANCLDATEEVPESLFQIYPNPVSDVLQIELKKVIQKEVYFSLYNSTGTSVFERKYDSVSDRVYIAVQDFPKGIYFLEIRVKANKYYKKIVVN